MLFVAPITAFALTVWAVALVLTRLTLDLPNHRSSHSVPTPRGGGLGVIPAILFAWLVFGDYRPWSLFAGALALMLGSWIDDKRGLSPLLRLGLQTAAVALFLWFQPLQSWLAIGFLALIWLWFINLYNFMDGIDGITGVETASIGLGIALVASHSDSTSGIVAPALCVAAGGIGFLVWNWHPAKVFLGDSGSVPLGLLIGGLLIELLMQGHWTAALILPGYYWADASLTLAKRLLNGEKIWQAHRKHYYQRASRGDAGPRKVSSTLFLGNLGLIWAAWIAETGQPGIGLCLGALIVTALLGLLRRWGRFAAP